MKLLKTRDFGDYFSDTFQFFKENFLGLILNYIKLQGILFISIIIAMYFYMQSILEEFSSVDQFGSFIQSDLNPQDAIAEYFALPIIALIIIGSISAIISANYLPVYMELYRVKQSDISFMDIVNKFKERAKSMIFMSLALLLLFIPIYFIVAITVFVSMITIVGWILVIAFYMSYFTQIWFYSNYYKTSSFNTLGQTFKLYKDNFFKITGATSILFLLVTIGYYIAVACIMLLTSMDITPESFSTETASFFEENMILISALLQPILLIIGSLITLFIQIQQGVIFYSRVNEMDQISEMEEIDSIGDNDDIDDDYHNINSFIKKH